MEESFHSLGCKKVISAEYLRTGVLSKLKRKDSSPLESLLGGMRNAVQATQLCPCLFQISKNGPGPTRKGRHSAETGSYLCEIGNE